MATAIDAAEHAHFMRRLSSGKIEGWGTVTYGRSTPFAFPDNVTPVAAIVKPPRPFRLYGAGSIEATTASASGEAKPSSRLSLAVIGRNHFGNPIPQQWYAAAHDLLADIGVPAVSQPVGAVENSLIQFFDEWEQIIPPDAREALASVVAKARAAQPVQAGEAVDEHEQAIDLMRKLERDGLEFVCMDGSANVVGIIKAAWKYRASLAPVSAQQGAAEAAEKPGQWGYNVLTERMEPRENGGFYLAREADKWAAHPAPAAQAVDALDAARYRALRAGNDYEKDGAPMVLLYEKDSDRGERPFWSIAGEVLDRAADSLIAASPASAPEAAHADELVHRLRHPEGVISRGQVREDMRKAADLIEAAHALQPAAPGEPVAIIGSGYAILWLGGEPIAHIVERHGIKVGDVLYTAAPTAGAATTELEKEVSIMYQMLDDGEWAEHVAKTCLGQQLETAITRAIGRVKSGAATTSEDARDAARWRAFLGSARIEPQGCAGVNEARQDHYAHIGLEIWTTYSRDFKPELLEKMDRSTALGRDWLTKYADVAVAAMRATQQEGGK
jgi:hypothetical protein